jgi:hypothetical protein
VEANGLILYEGESKSFAGGPIVAIVTGVSKASQNTKTGDMLQVYILRSDVNPIQAINEGLDASICGDCDLRGTVLNGRNVGRACYVSVRNAPHSVFYAYARGAYSHFLPSRDGAKLDGKLIRLAAYGDPAAVPFEIWENVLRYVDGHTGYTHFWRVADPRFKKILMASVHSLEEAADAQRSGWRYFRSRLHTDPRNVGEFECPASEEQGHRRQCNSCLSCNGSQSNADRANPVILIHGGLGVEANYRSTALPRIQNSQPRMMSYTKLTETF